MSIYPYQTREVRDLAWACFSSPLLDTDAMEGNSLEATNCAFPLTAKRRRWLETLDQNPAPLLQHLSDQLSRRLGLYFESLWHFFISRDDTVDLVAHNLPVREAGRTLGEFDILYFCRRRNCHVHLELAVKFYLGRASGEKTGTESAWRQWLGPEARDRLDIKMAHMLGHQIHLSKTEAAIPLLESLGVEQLEREIEVKGYLFRPLDCALPPPLAFNPKGGIHPWLRLSDLADKPAGIAADSYHVLPREHWLSAARLEPGAKGLGITELEQVLGGEMKQRPAPRLVAALDSHGQEIERFFVTQPDWPGL